MIIRGEIMSNNDLILHLNKLHTTELGVKRIQRNLSLENINVVELCRDMILREDAKIIRKGKNWYISIDDCIITVNAHSFTIITAH